MTNNPSPTPPVETLSDEALTEIERRKTRPSWREVAVLCQTVRAAWKERDRGALCEECDEWEYNEDGSCRTFTVCGACWNKLQETNTALREQLAELTDALRRQVDASIELESRLAQVEKERDDANTRASEAQCDVERLSQVIFRSDAATRMREACVEKVRAMMETWSDPEHGREDEISGFMVDAGNEIITALEGVEIK